MNTTAKGDELENKVYALVKRMVVEDKFGVSPTTSEVFHKKTYRSSLGKKITLDISIEVFIGDDRSMFSSLIAIECKNCNRKLDYADLCEFSDKITHIAECGGKGIIVTTKGFSKETIKEAKLKHLGLAVYKLDSKLDFITKRDINDQLYNEDKYNLLEGEPNTYHQFVLWYDNDFIDLNVFLKNNNVNIKPINYPAVPFLTNDELSGKVQSIFAATQNINENDILQSVIDNDLFKDVQISSKNSLPNNIMGIYSVADNSIHINPELKFNSPRWRFTCAHELGHCFLHKEIIYNYINSCADSEHSINLFEGSKDLQNIEQRMEIQANIFASYLLMPKNKFLEYTLSAMNVYDIRNCKLYVDSQACNIKNMNNVLQYIAGYFIVSKEAVKFRLIEEGFLKMGY